MTNPATVPYSGDFKGGPITIVAGDKESAGSVIATLVGGDAASAPPASAASPSPSAALAKGDAKAIDDGKGSFRALLLGRDESIMKMLLDEEHERIIGSTIVGASAGDLIAEDALTIEANSDASDIGLTIYLHPALSETIGIAAGAFEGTITDPYALKKNSAASIAKSADSKLSAYIY